MWDKVLTVRANEAKNGVNLKITLINGARIPLLQGMEEEKKLTAK